MLGTALDVELDTLHGVGAAALLRNEWNDLVLRSSGEVSLTWEWLLALEEVYFQAHPFHIITARLEGQLVGVWPLSSRRGRFSKLPARKVAAAVNRYCNHNDLVVSAPREQLPTVVLRMLEAAARSSDLIEMADVDASSPRMAALEQSFARLGMTLIRRHMSKSPFIPLEANFETFFQRLRSGDARRKIRKLQERLEAIPGYGMRVFRTPEEVRQGMDLILEVERHSWKAEGKSDIFSNPNQVAFYTRLAELAAESGWLALAVMTTDAGPIAHEYNLQFGARSSHLKGSYDERFEKMSPAKVLKREVLRDCCERGLAEYDYTGQEQEHKLEWTPHAREHEHWIAFNASSYGRLLSKVAPYGRW